MSNLFGRKASFLWWKRWHPPLVDDGIVNRIEGLRITFDITMSSDADANKGKFTIHNLSLDTRSKLETGEDLVGSLEVGYGTDVGELFLGDIEKVSSQRKAADIVTTIKIGDGNKALSQSIINKSYAPGISIKTIIADVVETFHQTAGTIIDGVPAAIEAISSTANQNGLSISGKAKDVLTKLLGKLDPNLEWGIQKDELKILDEFVLSDEEAISLSPQTGLIGIPYKSTKEDKEGTMMKSLIMAKEYRPGRGIQLTSEAISGIFKIREVKFVGDTHGQRWDADILGQKLD